MTLGGFEARGAVALAIMSAALLSLVHRGGALRVPFLHRSLCGFTRNGRSKGKERCCGGINGRSRGAHGRELGPEGTSLPDVVHKVVSAEELKAEVIVVGDIHGCYGEMVSLLERCGYRLGNREDRKRFSVVLAGDLVNKGPGNAEVVRTAREEGFLAVRGNHDNFIIAAVTKVGRFSESSVGMKRLPWVQELSSEDLQWLEDLPYTLSFPSLGSIVVHAGLVPGVPLDSQDPEAMSSMRNVVKAEGGDAYEARANTVEGIAWAKAWQGPEHVYFGHDAKRGFQKEAFATGLDTGCVYGRSLTAVVLPGGRVVCVPAEKTWSEPGGVKKSVK